MADWSTPGLTSSKVDVLSELKARDVDAISLSESITNPPTGAKRWVSASNKLQNWNGSAWVDLVLSIESGGTGGASASAARTSLGLGTMATQNSNSVSISGGAISGLSSIGASGNAAFGGILTLGSTPITISDSAGRILEASIADGTILARNAGNESITGNWTFNNLITGSISGNAGTVTSGLYTNATQTSTGRKSFSGSMGASVGTATGSLGAIEVIGDGTNAAFISFHRPSSFATYFGLDTDNQFKIGGWSSGPVAYPVLHSGNFNSYAPTLTGTGASGSWNITATLASSLTSNITINGVAANAGSNITVTAAAGTLTGSTLASGVTASSLTSLGTITNLTVGNGTASAPGLRLTGSTNSGVYYSGAAVEFGARFDNTDRSVMRAYTGSSKVDFLIGVSIPLELEDSLVTIGSSTPANLQVRGDITPAVDNTYQLGNSSLRFLEVWSVNGTLQTSDERHKRNHGAIEDALDLIRRLNPFVASWTQGPDNLRFPALSAQNVKEVIDDELKTEVVRVDIFDNHAMYYERLIPILCAAINQLSTEVQALKG